MPEQSAPTEHRRSQEIGRDVKATIVVWLMSSGGSGKPRPRAPSTIFFRKSHIPLTRRQHEGDEQTES
ncbi:MAG: hypothetical protein M3371_12930 [Acidobacteriota bacterium]|nr:hypothetical protein [Acidobacteriota bacterium]